MDGSREYVRSAVGKSLKWLDVKQIDLYYQHWVDRTLPIEDTWKALKVHQELVELQMLVWLRNAMGLVNGGTRTPYHRILGCSVGVADLR